MAFDVCVLTDESVSYIDLLKSRDFSVHSVECFIARDKMTASHIRAVTHADVASLDTVHLPCVYSADHEINISVGGVPLEVTFYGHTVFVLVELYDTDGVIVPVCLAGCISDEPIRVDENLMFTVNLEETRDVFTVRADFDGAVVQGLLKDRYYTKEEVDSLVEGSDDSGDCVDRTSLQVIDRTKIFNESIVSSATSDDPSLSSTWVTPNGIMVSSCTAYDMMGMDETSLEPLDGDGAVSASERVDRANLFYFSFDTSNDNENVMYVKSTLYNKVLDDGTTVSPGMQLYYGVREDAGIERKSVVITTDLTTSSHPFSDVDGQSMTRTPSVTLSDSSSTDEWGTQSVETSLHVNADVLSMSSLSDDGEEVPLFFLRYNGNQNIPSLAQFHEDTRLRLPMDYNTFVKEDAPITLDASRPIYLEIAVQESPTEDGGNVLSSCTLRSYGFDEVTLTEEDLDTREFDPFTQDASTDADAMTLRDAATISWAGHEVCFVWYEKHDGTYYDIPHATYMYITPEIYSHYGIGILFYTEAGEPNSAHLFVLKGSHIYDAFMRVGYEVGKDGACGSNVIPYGISTYQLHVDVSDGSVYTENMHSLVIRKRGTVYTPLNEYVTSRVPDTQGSYGEWNSPIPNMYVSYLNIGDPSGYEYLSYYDIQNMKNPCGTYDNPVGVVYTSSLMVGNGYSGGYVSMSLSNGGFDVQGHVTPHSNETYDLGSSGYRWRDVFAKNLHGVNDSLYGTGAGALYMFCLWVDLTDTPSYVIVERGTPLSDFGSQGLSITSWKEQMTMGQGAYENSGNPSEAFNGTFVTMMEFRVQSSGEVYVPCLRIL